jgi:hypothetical protein
LRRFGEKYEKFIGVVPADDKIRIMEAEYYIQMEEQLKEKL